MIYFFAYLLVGAVAGMFAGMLGIGGGAIVVPALVYLLKGQGIGSHLIMHMAAGTSIAVMVVTASSSLLGHLRHGVKIWSVYHRLFAGIVVGVITGVVLGRYIYSEILEILFAVFLLFVSIRMLFSVKSKPSRAMPGDLLTFFIAFIIGAKSGILGIGGGAVMIPFLIYCNVPVRKAIATSAACSLTIATMGTLSFVLTGMYVTGLPKWTTGYIYWPGVFGVAIASIIFAQIGANFSHIVSTEKLKKILGVVLLIIGIRMLF